MQKRQHAETQKIVIWYCGDGTKAKTQNQAETQKKHTKTKMRSNTRKHRNAETQDFFNRAPLFTKHVRRTAANPHGAPRRRARAAGCGRQGGWTPKPTPHSHSSRGAGLPLPTSQPSAGGRAASLDSQQ
eukprot:SAG11_NODE_1856_length_4162_cov_4.778981_3_plen_129_part_00